jgi:uncharacterized protein YdhG (YjbR/CyaY superfamily)
MQQTPATSRTKARTGTKANAKAGTGRMARFDTIDSYLATLDDDKRAALQKLRKDIHAAAPGAVECISYGLPAMRHRGRLLVAFGGAAKHCAFYPGAAPLKAHAKELEGYDTSKGTIRFAAERPLSTTLVRKIVRTRIAEDADKRALEPRSTPRRRKKAA